MAAALVRRLTFERFAIALLFVVLAIAACLMPAQTDTWWQLRTGADMWQTHRVMLHDEFTHTVAGGAWPNHEWLAQLAFYGLYRAGGLPLLTAACAASVTLAWALIAWITPGPLFLRLALLGGGAFLTSTSWSLRPQVFSLALLAVTLVVLIQRRVVWILPAVFLVWANLHGAVALGGVVLAAAVGAALATDREYARTLALVSAACLAATLATPLGVSLITEIPHSVRRLQSYGVLEWQAPAMTTADAPFWLAALTVAVALGLKRNAVRASWPAALLAFSTILFLALAVRTRRNIPPFAICAAPLIGTLFGRNTAEKVPARTERPVFNAFALAAVATVGVIVVAVAWGRPIPRLAWQPVSDDLRLALAACPGRLYNRYDEGGFLIWFVPERKVFMDSRQDPFPPSMVRRHIDVETSGDYDDLFAQYQIACALTVQGSPLAARLEHDRWERRTGSGSWALYSRTSPSAPAGVTGSEHQ